MADDGVEPAAAGSLDGQPEEQAPRRPRYLAEIDDEDARARARGHLLSLLVGGLLAGG